jgi:hypothetical protein
LGHEARPRNRGKDTGKYAACGATRTSFLELHCPPSRSCLPPSAFRLAVLPFRSLDEQEG